MQHAKTKVSAASAAAAAIGQKDPAIANYLSFLMFRKWDSSLDTACGQVALDAFEKPSSQDFEEFFKQIPKPIKNHQLQSWPLLEGALHAQEFLPIRAFRVAASRLWGPVEKLRIFLSSGTTSGPEGRSRSAYSPDGLLFYKAGSIWAFLSALERRAPPFCGDYLGMVSLSLIPPPSHWPDSSLAQMVGWFSEFWQTTYMDPESLVDLKQKFQQVTAAGRPVIIWGTAFHYVNLLDGGSFKTTLPKGSIVVETGGTKGKSRSVTRDELYQLIAEGFGIDQADIMSEYGMCELASQAWDVVEPGASARLTERTFRFPWWVQVAAMSKPAAADKKGIGALTVFDPLRVDLPGVAIQTEDLAHVFEDSSFALLGRVPRAPLKGCSLNAENLLTAKSSLQTSSAACTDYYVFNHEAVATRAPEVRRWLLELLSDQEAYESLIAEFQDSKIAKKALTDLTAGLPVDTIGFIQAAKNSIPSDHVPKRWLLIPPASHSIAFIYPLACALTLGLSLRVRLPKIQDLSSHETFLAKAVAQAVVLGFDIKTLPESWRLGDQDLLDGESVLVFGDDDTCKIMNDYCPKRVSAFGNAISICLVTKDDFADFSTLQLMMEDQFSLGQRGCLSSRAIICLGGNPDQIFEQLTSKGIIEDRSESIDTKTARAMEIVRLSQLGFKIYDRLNGITIGIKEISPKLLTDEAQAAISRLDFVVPILLVPEITDENTLIESLLKICSLRSIALGETLNQSLSKTESYPNLVKDVRLVRLGTLGAPHLDGLHLGRRFFAS